MTVQAVTWHLINILDARKEHLFITTVHCSWLVRWLVQLCVRLLDRFLSHTVGQVARTDSSSPHSTTAHPYKHIKSPSALVKTYLVSVLQAYLCFLSRLQLFLVHRSNTFRDTERVLLFEIIHNSPKHAVLKGMQINALSSYNYLLSQEVCPIQQLTRMAA